MKKTFTLTELAEYLKGDFCKRTLERMIADGRFPVEPIKGIKPRRWRKIDVDKWLNGGRT